MEKLKKKRRKKSLKENKKAALKDCVLLSYHVRVSE